MADKPQDKEGPESFFADWMKTSTAFWESMTSMWISAEEASRMTLASKRDGKRSRVHESWETTQKTWKAWSQVMSEPDTMETLFKGTGMLPEIFLKMVQTGLNSFMQFQQQWIEQAGKVGESTKGYTFENLDEDVLKAWNDLYRKEVRKFFNIPQLGLTRLYQEKMFRLMDKFNVYQATVAEFIHILYFVITQ